MLAAVAMSFSSIFVVSNALRLKLIKVKNFENKNTSDKRDKVNINKVNTLVNSSKIKEKKISEKRTMKIEGMMCNHCVKHVKEALEALNGISNVEVSLNNNEATFEQDASIEDSTVKEAIEDLDYKVLDLN